MKIECNNEHRSEAVLRQIHINYLYGEITSIEITLVKSMLTENDTRCGDEAVCRRARERAETSAKAQHGLRTGQPSP